MVCALLKISFACFKAQIVLIVCKEDKVGRVRVLVKPKLKHSWLIFLFYIHLLTCLYLYSLKTPSESAL